MKRPNYFLIYQIKSVRLNIESNMNLCLVYCHNNIRTIKNLLKSYKTMLKIYAEQRNEFDRYVNENKLYILKQKKLQELNYLLERIKEL